MISACQLAARLLETESPDDPAASVARIGADLAQERLQMAIKNAVRELEASIAARIDCFPALADEWADELATEYAEKYGYAADASAYGSLLTALRRRAQELCPGDVLTEMTEFPDQENAADTVRRMIPGLEQDRLNQAVEGAKAEFYEKVDACAGSADRADELAGDLAYDWAQKFGFGEEGPEWEAILSVLFKLSGECCPEDEADGSELPIEEGRRGPNMKTLKANRTELTDAERKEVLRRGAVWHHGRTPEEKTPAVWKAEVRGKNWYVCNTHRAMACKPTLRGAIRAYAFIKTTS